MKRINPIREILGLTQHDISMLLKITRSQWSMYELGKRELPTAAQLLLTDILIHQQAPETVAKKESQWLRSFEPTQKSLESLLYKNKFQRLSLVRKIAGLQKKHTAHLQLSLAVDFLTLRNSDKAHAMTPLQPLVNKLSHTARTNLSAILMQHKHKLEVLELEKSLLESKMQLLVSKAEIK